MGFNAKYTGAQVEELLDKIPKANNIWHSGNFNPSNYLPLSGGTLSSNLTIQNKAVDVITLYRDDANNSPSIKCTNKSDGTLGYIGVSGSGSGIGIQPFFMDSAGTVNKLWHSGNDGSGSGLDADLLDGKQPNELNVASATKASQDGEGSNIVATYVKKTVLADWQYFQYRGTCSNINAQTLPGMYDYADTSNAIAGTNYGILLCFYNRDFPTTWAWGVQVFFGDNNKFAYRTSIRKAGVWNNWVIVA